MKKTYRCLVGRHVMEAVPGDEYLIVLEKWDEKVMPVEEATMTQLKKGTIRLAMPLIQPVAVLSTTVLPLDGVYEVKTVDTESIDITGVPHYIGHPATKAIVEQLGAVPAKSKLFEGLRPGEEAVCFAIAQGKSTRVKDGFTSPHQDVKIADITCRVIRHVYVWESGYGRGIASHPNGEYYEV